MNKTLDDLLEHDGPRIVDLSEFLPAPRKAREAYEVVLFWTEWVCHCGRRYERPTYGDTLTRYKIYKYGKVVATQYEPYLPACHANLPRRTECHTLTIQHCPVCLHESELADQLQMELPYASNDAS
jgi:hypothetical protein